MRGPELSSSVVRFGTFEADLRNGLLHCKGIRIKLQEQPFRILALLLESPGQVVTRETIRQVLWPDGTFVDFDGGLNAAMKKLRVALNDATEKPQFIETIPKRGYRFIARVTQEVPEIDSSRKNLNFASLPANKVRRSPADGITPWLKTQQSGQRIAILLGIFLLALAGIVAYRWHGRGQHAVDTTEAAMKPIPTRQGIAVLGFHNVSGKPEDAWLSTALSEMMSTELAAGDKLRLVPGEDVSNLRLSSPWSQTDTLGQPTTSRIGMALNSDLLVLGSFTSVGARASRQLRLDVRLQNAKTGEILTEFAEIGSDQNLFQLVSHIGGRMRDRLGVPAVQQAEEPNVFSSLPSNSEAARFYSLGLAKLREFDGLSAKDLLQRAVEADPKFPLSHSMLFRAWESLGYDRDARKEAKSALDLSDGLPVAEKLLVEGAYYETFADPEKAISTYRTLYAMFPDSVDDGLLLVAMLNKAGRREEALEVIRQLRRLSPPAGDDARLDIWEAQLVSYNSGTAPESLIRSGASKAKARGQTLLYARARLDQCSGAIWSNNPQSAIPYCEEAYQLFIAAGNRSRAAAALRLIADRRADEGRTAEALLLYYQAIRTLREIGSRWGLGAALNNMAILLENQGQLDRAKQVFQEAQGNFEVVGDKHSVGTALVNIADLLVEQGNLSSASKTYQRSLAFVASVTPTRTGYAYYRIANLQLIKGDLAGALQEVQQAESIYRGLGGRFNEAAESMSVQGNILLAKGELPAARQKCQEAFEIRQKLNDAVPLAESKAEIAKLALEEGRPAEAEAELRDAIIQFHSAKASTDEISALTLLSRILLVEGHLEDARNINRQASDLSQSNPDPSLKLSAAIQDARIKLGAAGSRTAGRRSWTAARTELMSALETANELGYYGIRCEARLALGELEMRANPKVGRAQLSALAKETHDRGFELISRKAAQLLSSTRL